MRIYIMVAENGFQTGEYDMRNTNASPTDQLVTKKGEEVSEQLLFLLSHQQRTINRCLTPAFDQQEGRHRNIEL